MLYERTSALKMHPMTIDDLAISYRLENQGMTPAVIKAVSVEFLHLTELPRDLRYSDQPIDSEIVVRGGEQWPSSGDTAWFRYLATPLTQEAVISLSGHRAFCGSTATSFTMTSLARHTRPPSAGATMDRSIASFNTAAGITIIGHEPLLELTPTSPALRPAVALGAEALEPAHAGTLKGTRAAGAEGRGVSKH